MGNTISGAEEFNGSARRDSLKRSGPEKPSMIWEHETRLLVDVLFTASRMGVAGKDHTMLIVSCLNCP